MAISPASPDFFEKKFPFQASKAQEIPGEILPDSFQKVEQAVHKAISFARLDREVALRGLSSNISEKVSVLQKKLVLLRELSLKVCAINDESKRLDDCLFELQEVEDDSESANIDVIEKQIRELEPLIDKANEDMKVSIEKLSVEYSELKIRPELFSDWWQLDRIEKYQRDLALEFMQEQLFNSCVDQLSFIHDVCTLIEERKSEIARMFYLGDFNSLNLDQTAFAIFPVEAETHNRGKLPVQIIFYSGSIRAIQDFF